jgi:hypothetical protein
VLEGETVYAPISAEEDFAEWESKLQGKMVLIDEVGPSGEAANRDYTSYDDEMLDQLLCSTYRWGDARPAMSGPKTSNSVMI